MQLERLKIQNSRNLRDFEITFADTITDADGAQRKIKSHAVMARTAPANRT